MPNSVNRFDDFLEGKLGECADSAGQDVDTYIAHAVAAQMVSDLRETDSPSAQAILDRISEVGLPPAAEPPEYALVINDPERLEAVRATGLIGSPAEPAYDRITHAATSALRTPRAVLALADRDHLFLKATTGFTPSQRLTPLVSSVTRYVVASGVPLILEDARVDPVYKNHPQVLAGSVVAYLGIPLVSPDHHTVGALCVYDDTPRQWGSGHVQVLSDLAVLATKKMFS